MGTFPPSQRWKQSQRGGKGYWLQPSPRPPQRNTEGENGSIKCLEEFLEVLLTPSGVQSSPAWPEATLQRPWLAAFQEVTGTEEMLQDGLRGSSGWRPRGTDAWTLEDQTVVNVSWNKHLTVAPRWLRATGSGERRPLLPSCRRVGTSSPCPLLIQGASRESGGGRGVLSTGDSQGFPRCWSRRHPALCCERSPHGSWQTGQTSPNGPGLPTSSLNSALLRDVVSSMTWT